MPSPVMPPLTTVGYRVRSNSTRAPDGDGLRITAVAAAANADVDNNVVGQLVHVVEGERYDFTALLTLAAATAGNRVGQMALEWLQIGAGEDGYGGAIISSAQTSGTCTPGVERTLALTNLTAPPGAARARIILRLQHNATTSPVAASDSMLFRQVALTSLTPPPVTVTATGGGAAAAGSQQTITATASGGVAPLTMALTQTTGPARTLTRSGNSWSFTTPRTAAGVQVAFRVTATDSAATPATATTTVTYDVAADPDAVDSGGSGDGWPSWLPRLSGQALVQVLVPDGAWTPPPPTDPTPQPSTGYATTYPATY